MRCREFENNVEALRIPSFYCFLEGLRATREEALFPGPMLNRLIFGWLCFLGLEILELGIVEDFVGLGPPIAAFLRSQVSKTKQKKRRWRLIIQRWLCIV